MLYCNKKMIPFKLFKYIYFRNIIYGIIITLPVVIITDIFLFTIEKLVGKHVIFLSIALLAMLIIIVLANKFILNKIIFKEYKRIKVNTSLQSVNIKLTIMFIIFTRLIFIIPSFGFMKMANLLFNNYNISLLFSSIISIFIEYYITNLFLERYITVSELENT